MYKVLAADDEGMIRRALEQLIDWEGLDCRLVFTARDGAEAYQYLKENPVDIAVLDIRMPGLSGMQIAELLQQEKRDVSVIILTAYTEFELVRDSLRLHVCDYVVKSNFEVELPQAVKRAIARWRELPEGAKTLGERR